MNEAAACYSSILAVEPRDAEANHLLGLISFQQGRLPEAITLIQRAIDLDDGFAPYHLNLGNAYQESGDLPRAINAFRRALGLDHSLSFALYNLANAFQRSGDLEQARQSYQRYVEVNPQHAEAHFNLAHVLRKQGHLDDAIASLRTAISFEPHPEECHLELGLALQQAGQMSDAIPELERFVDRNPNHSAALYSLGVALLHTQATGEALVLFNRCIVLDPTVAEYYYSLADTNWRLGRYRHAKAAALISLKLRPNYAEAEGLLVISSAAVGSISNEAADKLLAESTAWRNPRMIQILGTILVHNGKKRQGLEVLNRLESMDLPVGERVKNAMLLPVIIPSNEEIAYWRQRWNEGFDKLIESGAKLTDPVAEVGRTNFYMAYHSLDDRPAHEKMARFYRQACPSLTFEAPHVSDGSWAPPKNRKIRIGVVSQHLCNHTIGKLNRGWLANLNRDRFHLTVFQIPRTTRRKDAMARQIAESADQAVTLTTRLSDARKTISEAELDILCYPDIGMDPHTYFLAFARLAPVQCVTWGHPVTTGIDTVDYFLSSRELDPPGSEENYTEKLVRLDDVNTYYYQPAGESPFVRTLLLDERGHRLYVCVQTLFKLHPDFDHILAQILRKDPLGKLVFIRGAEPYMESQLLERFSRSMPDVLDRIMFIPTLPQKRFFELLQIADVLLDTPSFGGGNTSLEAFGFCAPVVTLDRPLMRERITPALYRQMNMEDLIARTADEYVELAVRCATNPDWHRQMQEKIASRRSVIFQNRNVIEQMEAFFEQAVEAAGKARKPS